MYGRGGGQKERTDLNYLLYVLVKCMFDIFAERQKSHNKNTIKHCFEDDRSSSGKALFAVVR